MDMSIREKWEQKENLSSHESLIWIYNNWRESSIVVKKNYNLLSFGTIYYLFKGVQSLRVIKIGVYISLMVPDGTSWDF